VDILKKDFKGNLFHFSTLLFKYLCFLKKASNKSKASCILTPCLLQFPKYYVYQKLILKKNVEKKTQIWRNWQTRKTSNNDQAKRLDCRPQVTTIFQQRLAFDRRRHRHRDHDHVAATTTAIVIMLFSLNEPHSGLAFFQPSQTQANTAS